MAMWDRCCSILVNSFVYYFATVIAIYMEPHQTKAKEW